VTDQQHSRSLLPSISAPLLWFDQLLVRDLPYWPEELGEAPFWGRGRGAHSSRCDRPANGGERSRKLCLVLPRLCHDQNASQRMRWGKGPGAGTCRTAAPTRREKGHIHPRRSPLEFLREKADPPNTKKQQEDDLHEDVLQTTRLASRSERSAEAAAEVAGNRVGDRGGGWLSLCFKCGAHTSFPATAGLLQEVPNDGSWQRLTLWFGQWGHDEPPYPRQLWMQRCSDEMETWTRSLAPAIA
jgi:hypothetical protein